MEKVGDGSGESGRVGGSGGGADRGAEEMDAMEKDGGLSSAAVLDGSPAHAHSSAVHMSSKLAVPPCPSSRAIPCLCSTMRSGRRRRAPHQSRRRRASRPSSTARRRPTTRVRRCLPVHWGWLADGCAVKLVVAFAGSAGNHWIHRLPDPWPPQHVPSTSLASGHPWIKLAPQAPHAGYFLHNTAFLPHHQPPAAGRSWIEPPKEGRRPEAEQCFLPKRHIHTWSGHTKGVNAIRWVGGQGKAGDCWMWLRKCCRQAGRLQCSLRSPSASGNLHTSLPTRLPACLSQLLPTDGPPAAVGGAGWRDQDLGCGHPQEVHALIPGPHQGAPAWGWCCCCCCLYWQGGRREQRRRGRARNTPLLAVGGSAAPSDPPASYALNTLPTTTLYPGCRVHPLVQRRLHLISSHPPHRLPSSCLYVLPPSLPLLPGCQGHLVLQRRPPVCVHRVRQEDPLLGHRDGGHHQVSGALVLPWGMVWRRQFVSAAGSQRESPGPASNEWAMEAGGVVAACRGSLGHRDGGHHQLSGGAMALPLGCQNIFFTANQPCCEAVDCWQLPACASATWHARPNLPHPPACVAVDLSPCPAPALNPTAARWRRARCPSVCACTRRSSTSAWLAHRRRRSCSGTSTRGTWCRCENGQQGGFKLCGKSWVGRQEGKVMQWDLNTGGHGAGAVRPHALSLGWGVGGTGRQAWVGGTATQGTCAGAVLARRWRWDWGGVGLAGLGGGRSRNAASSWLSGCLAPWLTSPAACVPHSPTGLRLPPGRRQHRDLHRPEPPLCDYLGCVHRTALAGLADWMAWWLPGYVAQSAAMDQWIALLPAALHPHSPSAPLSACPPLQTTRRSACGSTASRPRPSTSQVRLRCLLPWSAVAVG